MQELDYAWLFEAGTEYVCPIEDDSFQYMFEQKKLTSFSMALYEYRETIPSLFETVMRYANMNKDWIQPKEDSNTLWHFILNDENDYNGCHLWNNFQVSNSSNFPHYY